MLCKGGVMFWKKCANLLTLTNNTVYVSYFMTILKMFLFTISVLKRKVIW